MVQEQQRKQQQTEDRLRQREQQLNQRQGDLQRQQNEYQQQKQKLDQVQQSIEFKQRETEKMHKQALQQLETLSGMSADEAKAQLVESLKDEAKTNAMAYINDMMEEAKQTVNKEAKKIIVQAIQRVAS